MEPSENRLTAKAISPDGQSLAYAEIDGSLYLRRLATGTVRPLLRQGVFRSRPFPGF
jgi:hypothetical protein